MILLALTFQVFGYNCAELRLLNDEATIAKNPLLLNRFSLDLQR